MNTVMDKDRLAAFVDGELAPEEAAAVVMHLADHPGDQAYVDDLTAANEALAQAFAGPLSEPVPPAILAAIRGAPAEAPAAPASPAGATVVPFRPRPRPMALVGGLALAAALAGVALLWPGAAPQGGAVALGLPTLGPLAAGDALAGLVETQPAGAPLTLASGAEAMVLESFQTGTGRFCREIEVIDRARSQIGYAIACRAAAGWAVEVALAEAAGGSATDFAPAAGEEAQALTLFLRDAGETRPLDPAAEAAAIARGWTAAP
jgi:hypothetical protein